MHVQMILILGENFEMDIASFCSSHGEKGEALNAFPFFS